MPKIALWAAKGGVGKSTVSAGLACALRDRGYRVGALDVDITSTGLHRAFNLDASYRLGVDTREQKMLPIEMPFGMAQGIKLFCLAWKFTEDACIGWREQEREVTLSDGEKILDAGRRGFIREILTTTIDWGELDYLICDLPPASGTEVLSFFDYIGPELLGVVLVSQPSLISAVGLRKTIDFLKTQQKPIIGLVENMAMCLCPQCGASFYPFTSGAVDLKVLAKWEGIPFLISIPQSPNIERLRPYFDGLAEKVIKAKPKVFRQAVLGKRARLERGAVRKVLRL